MMRLALKQSRCALRHVLEQHFAPAVQQQTVQGRLVLVLCEGITRLACTSSAPGEDLDGVPRGVSQQEPVHEALAWACEIAEAAIHGRNVPSSCLGERGLVRLCHLDSVQSIQRHGSVSVE